MPLKVNLAHHPLDAFGVDLDLGHVFPQDPAGYVLRGGWGPGGDWGVTGVALARWNHLPLAMISHPVERGHEPQSHYYTSA
jgi:hypothetical protein